MTTGKLCATVLVLGVLAQVCGCKGGGSNPSPQILSLSPSSSFSGSSAENVTVVGYGFLSDSTVTFNGVAHAASYVDSAHLTLTLSSTDQATSGTYPVVVTNPAPGGGTSNSMNFSVVNPNPTISGLMPSYALAGASPLTLAINGVGFLSGATVTFAGTAHPATFVSSTQLTIALTAPDVSSIGEYPVVVTNPAPGGPSSPYDFTVASSAALASAMPTNALGVLVQGNNVTAYVPNGSWETTVTGIQVVPIEPTPVGTPSSISTPGTVNSCASNFVTGETACTADNTDIYLITGSTLNTTLTSGSNSVAHFSSGQCNNCTVSIDGVNNTALISLGLVNASGSGIQILNLANNTLAAPVASVNFLSEGVQLDPTRNLIFSPNESGVYDLFQAASMPAVEFADAVSEAPKLDSAAEDYTTGIALGPVEFSAGQIYITDASQAAFTSGSPTGRWTAPGQIVTIPEFAGFSHGPTGMSSVPGYHLAIVTGEDGGNQFGVIQLPSTSGSGTPSFVDYAAATLPNTPDGQAWVEGDEPHQVSAYVSPTSSKPYGLLANGSPATYVAAIDLQALLAAPRTAGTHTVSPSYDLEANGVVRYVSTNYMSAASQFLKGPYHYHP